jgi:hypothetical protein
VLQGPAVRHKTGGRTVNAFRLLGLHEVVPHDLQGVVPLGVQGVVPLGSRRLVKPPPLLLNRELVNLIEMEVAFVVRRK